MCITEGRHTAFPSQFCHNARTDRWPTCSTGFRILGHALDDRPAAADGAFLQVRRNGRGQPIPRTSMNSDQNSTTRSTTLLNETFPPPGSTISRREVSKSPLLKSSLEKAPQMEARFIDARRVPRDLRVFALDADVLQVGELRTGRPDMILERPQSAEPGIRAPSALNTWSQRCQALPAHSRARSTLRSSSLKRSTAFVSASSAEGRIEPERACHGSLPYLTDRSRGALLPPDALGHDTQSRDRPCGPDREDYPLSTATRGVATARDRGRSTSPPASFPTPPCRPSPASRQTPLPTPRSSQTSVAFVYSSLGSASRPFERCERRSAVTFR